MQKINDTDCISKIYNYYSYILVYSTFVPILCKPVAKIGLLTPPGNDLALVEYDMIWHVSEIIRLSKYK